MPFADNLIAFTLAATLLTLSPGLDTALILRTAAVESRQQALRAALGINAGCLLWGAAVASHASMAASGTVRFSSVIAARCAPSHAWKSCSGMISLSLARADRAKGSASSCRSSGALTTLSPRGSLPRTG
jgi:threonine/homoserine/homoserine lactone efflux protein